MAEQSGGVRKEVIRVAGTYTAVAGAWILLSDYFLWNFVPAGAWPHWSVVKGLTFVLATAALLAVLLTRTFRSIHRSRLDVEHNRQRFQRFMDNLPVVAFLKDRGGRYFYLNPYFRERFALRRAAEGETSAAYFPEDLVERFSADDQKVIETGQVVESELRFAEDGGGEHWLVRRFPVPSGDGGEPLIGGFAVDITERDRLEEQLRQAGKMEALGRVAGGIAHDFNNMLTVVNGYASLLARSLGETPEGRKAQEIQQVGEKAANLTHQLLAFSRKHQHHPESLDLNQVVREMETVIRPLLTEGVEIVMALDPGLPVVTADHSQMQQILMNLALNARDAMGEGGLLSIETRKVRSASGEQRVQLTVRDNGCGMDAAVKERIFEPFFTTKGSGKGIGLGLATVYGAVKQNAGTIAVESEPGRGAVFTVTFPAAG